MRFAAPRDSEALMGVMHRTTATMAVASAQCLRAVAQYDQRKLWRRDGATAMSSWLAARYGLAWGTAREWVRVAHALRRLPRIAEAYADGRLSWDQLRPLTRFATPETDQYWSRRAPKLRRSTLVREAKRHQRVRTEDVREIHRKRYVSLWWDPESPILYLEGMVGAEQGAARRPWSAGPRRWCWKSPPRTPGVPGWATPWWSWLPEETGPGAAGRGGDARWGRGPDPRGARYRSVAGRDRDGRAAELRSGPPPGLRREDRVGPGVTGLAPRDRPPRPDRPGPAPQGAPPPGPRDMPLPRMRAEAVDERPSPGPLGRRRGHQPGQLVLLCHAHHRLIHEGGWRTSGHPARDLRFHDSMGRQLRRVLPPFREDSPNHAVRAP
jgi:hypothetical protein